jgi:hypothetical protein
MDPRDQIQINNLVNNIKMQEITDLIKNWKTNEIPKEFLTEEIFSSVIDADQNTILHLCACYSCKQSFSKLPENLKQEKYLLLKNNAKSTILHILIEQQNAKEVPQEIIFKNLGNKDTNKNTLLHRLGTSNFPTPIDWFKHPSLTEQNIFFDTPLHIFAKYQPSNIPSIVTREQMLTLNLLQESSLDIILKGKKIETINTGLLAKLKIEDLFKSSTRYPVRYTNAELKQVHTEAISQTIKKRLTEKTAKPKIKN